jgi:predicted GIY-YIG superfamily endonuclease
MHPPVAVLVEVPFPSRKKAMGVERSVKKFGTTKKRDWVERAANAQEAARGIRYPIGISEYLAQASDGPS